MPTYNNPSSMFGNNANMIPGQPFAGYLAGMQGAYSQHVADQGIRDSDQAFMANMHKYEQDKLDDPMRAAQRESGMAAAGTTAAWNQSGGAMDALQTDLASKKASMEEVKLKTEETLKEMKGRFLAEVSDELDKLPDAMTQTEEAIKSWAELKEKGKKIGFDLGPQSTPTDEMKAQIKAKAAAWRANNKTGEKMREIAAQQAGDLAKATDPTKHAQAVELENIKVTGRKDVADTRADATVEAAKQRATAAAAAIRTFEQDAVKSLREGDISGFSRAVDKMYLEEVKGNKMLPLNKGFLDDPAAFEAEWKRKKKLELMEAVQMKKGEAAQTILPGKSDVVTTKEQYDALPIGAEYKDSNGKSYKKK